MIESINLLWPNVYFFIVSKINKIPAYEQMKIKKEIKEYQVLWFENGGCRGGCIRKDKTKKIKRIQNLKQKHNKAETNNFSEDVFDYFSISFGLCVKKQTNTSWVFFYFVETLGVD